MATTWLLVFISISICAIFKFIFSHRFTSNTSSHRKLPPSPQSFPIISSFLWLRRLSPSNIESILKSLHAKLGPILTIYLGRRPLIFIADRLLAYQVLVKNGAISSNRPPASATQNIVSNNQRNISLSSYGPIWRLLRRNLAENFVHPSCAKAYSHSRRRVLKILENRLESAGEKSGPHGVCVKDHLLCAMFGLLVIMCFGDEVDENQIEQIKEANRLSSLNFPKYDILNLWPRLTKIVLRRRWEEFLEFQKNKHDVSIPLIKARKKLQEQEKTRKDTHHAVSYVDTLLNLEIPDEKRNFTEVEISNLCIEFLAAGTDTTTAALEWIMANLVKYPEIQDKLFLEIKGVVGNGDQEEVSESDLKKMPYLKAVILETLRRHPPVRFMMPHMVAKDIVVDGYLIPKNAATNFLVAEMGWDPKVWEDPMAFKPERFLNNDGGRQLEFDVTGSKEIKMMPFGSGRRICPGYQLALLHLEYFVANLIWKYDWKAVGFVDLSEKMERAVVMKNPLEVHFSPRLK